MIGDRGPVSEVDVEAARNEQCESESPATARWVPLAALALSLAGLADATYLTYDHFSGNLPICSSHGIINCALVTTSAQSYLFHLPVSVLGLAFFATMTLVNLPVSWRSSDARIHWFRLALAIVGMGMVIYLLVAELVVIKAICLWCTGVHAITFLLFVLVVSMSPTLLRSATAYGSQ